MGTTISGPQVYVPDAANPFQSPSAGWSSGISAIGNALFPNPAALSEARLRAAQTQQVQQNIQQTAAATGARSHLASLFAAPGALADPNARSQASSLIAMLPPEEQSQARQNIAIQMANSGLPQATIDTWNSSAGLTNLPQTQTGINMETQRAINVANIGAGATIGAAKISAGAELAANAARVAETAREFNTTPQETVQNGTVVNVPRGPVAGAQPTWAGQPAAVATDIARSAAAIGATPLGNGPAAPQSHGVSPPAVATQPQAPATGVGGVVAQPAGPDGSPAGTPGGPPGPAGPAGPNQDALATRMTLLSGLPANRLTPTEALQMNVLLDQKAQELGTSLPLGQGQFYKFGPNLQAQLSSRANQLMQSTDRRFANNPQAAIDQAYNEIVTPNKGALVYDARRGTGLNPVVDLPVTPPPASAPAPTPTTPLVPSANAAPVSGAPPPMPPSGRANIPAQLHPSAQPGGGGIFRTSPGGSIAPTTATVPGVPAPGPHQGEAQTPAAPVGPAPMPPNQLVPNRSKVNGYVYTGGNPRSPTSWMKAPGG